MRQNKTFFARHHVDLARDLIGCRLHWDGVSGIIVETEAYAAEDDPACHTYSRQSARDFFYGNSPGIVYVYLSYGVHWMLNVLAADGIVLFRAIQPTSELALLTRRRGTEKPTQLCSGPGKLGQALALSAADHGGSLLTQKRHIKLPCRADTGCEVLTDRRVGITQAVERPWRFLMKGNPHISVGHGRTASRRPRRRR